MVTIALDADGRRRFQERLEQQFRQSQKMEAVGRLAGGVAHDFNNLLTVINGSSALLLDRLPAEDPQRMLVEETLKAGERGADLTKQLLAFSRQQVLKLEVLDLNAALRAITKLIERLIGEDITLTVTLDPELWPIHADRVQIDQVLMNLAVNARDAMPEGGQVTVETRNVVVTPETRVPHPVFAPGEYVHLAVRDSGSGMDQETLTHIFEPFFTTKQEGHGTGLGLATVYGIVKQSRGFIFVDSAQGQGATFNLYFPRMEPQAAATPAASATPSTTGSERVLVVEDQGSVRQLIVQALKSYGYDVFEAANGEDALRLAATLSEPVQALVTDVIMPQIAGPVIAERLRAYWPGLRVLFVSGYTERFKPTFLNLPSTLFIRKPFLPAELAAHLRNLLDAEGVRP
jgi:nitrogen-specific signal transduction histidine kinase